MKKLVTSAILVLIVASMVIGIVAAQEPFGPAPNAGDCIPDGSGHVIDEWANENAPDAKGPAPNAGDGISDGSGF
jgi:hypothetical protein